MDFQAKSEFISDRVTENTSHSTVGSASFHVLKCATFHNCYRSKNLFPRRLHSQHLPNLVSIAKEDQEKGTSS